MPIKQSFCFPMYTSEGMPLDTLLARASEIGYAAVELWGRGDDFAAFAVAAKRQDLVVASMIGHGALGDGLNNPANHDRIEAELRVSIDVAVQYGVPNLICFSGNRREGLSEEEGIAHTAAGLKRVAAYAEAKGVNLNVELLNSKVDHAGYQCDRTAWGVAVCEQVASERVKLLYDIYHMQIMEGDIIRTIRDNIQWIGHFHTAGNPGRHDMDDTQELNYTGICAAIAALDYDGYVGHEFSPKGDPAAALQTAYEQCHVD